MIVESNMQFLKNAHIFNIAYAVLEPHMRYWAMITISGLAHCTKFSHLTYLSANLFFLVELSAPRSELCLQHSPNDVQAFVWLSSISPHESSESTDVQPITSALLINQLYILAQ
jgi:hypothetical protein